MSNIPKLPRTAVLPLWNGSQANPTRGSKLRRVKFPNRGPSPAHFPATTVPQWGSRSVKLNIFTIPPWLSLITVDISQRSPRFNVRFGRKRQSSCMYRPKIVCRSPCGLTVLASSPVNLLGLLVSKSDSEPNEKTPLGSVWVRRLSCCRSTPPPNLMEWVPCVQKASSYPWKEFQAYRAVEFPFTPPVNWSIA